MRIKEKTKKSVYEKFTSLYETSDLLNLLEDPVSLNEFEECLAAITLKHSVDTAIYQHQTEITKDMIFNHIYLILGLIETCFDGPKIKLKANPDRISLLTESVLDKVNLFLAEKI